MRKSARSPTRQRAFREWINSAGNDIEQPLLDYLAPLILGESQVSYHNGLPVYMDVSHLSKH